MLLHEGSNALAGLSAGSDREAPRCLVTQIHSAELDLRRTVRVWLPPGIEHGLRCPVVYAQDGERVLGRGASAWDAGAILEHLAHSGRPLILVAIDAGERRAEDYSPFTDPVHGGGEADRYVDFLADTLKPWIDAEFPTLAEPHATLLCGSSLGAMLAVHGCIYRGDAFAACAAFSPSVSFADGALEGEVEDAGSDGSLAGFVYLDAGTREFDRSGPGASELYLTRVRSLGNAFLSRGLAQERELFYREVPGGRHDEASWRERLPEALTLFDEHARQHQPMRR